MKPAKDLRDALAAVPEGSEVVCDGHDLVVTRPDGSKLAIPVGGE